MHARHCSRDARHLHRQFTQVYGRAFAVIPAAPTSRSDIRREAPMLDLSTPKGRIVAAALRLAGERRWRDVTLADIATAADVRLVDLRREFDTKGEILAAFVRAVDDALLARTPERSASDTTSPRDAIFEVVMSRFDVLAPYRPALKSIAESWPTDPALLRALAVSSARVARGARPPPRGLAG